MLVALDKQEFINYLAGNLATSFHVGAGSEYSCPLAAFLTAKYQKDVEVDAERFTVGTDIFPTPEWAYEFISKVDQTNGGFLAPITGLTALSILCPEYWEGA